jgi:hypothetical protein
VIKVWKFIDKVAKSRAYLGHFWAIFLKKCAQRQKNIAHMWKFTPNLVTLQTNVEEFAVS